MILRNCCFLFPYTTIPLQSLILSRSKGEEKTRWQIQTAINLLDQNPVVREPRISQQSPHLKTTTVRSVSSYLRVTTAGLIPMYSFSYQTVISSMSNTSKPSFQPLLHRCCPIYRSAVCAPCCPMWKQLRWDPFHVSNTMRTKGLRRLKSISSPENHWISSKQRMERKQEVYWMYIETTAIESASRQLTILCLREEVGYSRITSPFHPPIFNWSTTD